MDRPSNQPAPAQNPRPGHRDMMFCHECADEWYRDEHGLTCPECGSDFTEIIEDNNDPRDSVVMPDDADGSDSMPDLEEAPPHEHPTHNPWLTGDPDEADISNFQFTRTGPTRFNVQATITRSVSPQGLQQGNMAPATIGGFMSMLSGLTGAAVRPQGQQSGHSEALFSAPNQNQSAFQEARGQARGGQPQFRTGRFSYHADARLYPRDANNPQARMEPVDDLTNVMAGVMAALGAPPGSLRTHTHQDGGAGATFRGENNNPDQAQMAANPFMQLFTSMGLMGGGQMGDFVYSQEGFDRIVSQLMEQTATSNAPGPASQVDIDALPRKRVTEAILGDEHKAECSICMDEVHIGEEVTELPCKHWFHHACVSAWLVEHDTCPHCRKGITKQPAEGQAGQPTPSATSQSDPTFEMPGAFHAQSGSGTFSDPFVVRTEAGSSSSNQQSSSDNAANSNLGSGGISDRIRRGLFGPRQ